MSFVIALLYILLVPLSVFLVLVVLMQKSKSDGGVGAALGGGASEAAFGPDTGNVLATVTRNGTIAFFVLCFGLYLAQIARHTDKVAGEALPAIEVPAEVPAAIAPEGDTVAPVVPVEDAAVTAPVTEGATAAEPAR
jgi:preprotein translocase subunit SecG